MSVYVMSDIHGDYAKFKSMLRKIKFNENIDKLYILGDMIDREPGSIEILETVMDSKNKCIEAILGNHEQMMLDYYNNREEEFDWIKHGGESTHKQFRTKTQYEKAKILNFLQNLPTYIVFDNYLLIHGGLFIPGHTSSLEEALSNSDKNDFLLDREFFISNKTVTDYIVICGHTSVQSLGKNKIIHKTGKILIDCGCGFSDGRLACLRLDDMKEFYI